jgi:hypothetical protein
VLVVESRVEVHGVSAAEITDFMLTCTDRRYQEWWPGTHLRMHVATPGRADHVGDVVQMDEYVGTRRIRLAGVVVEAVPGERIVWQLRKGIRLPVRLALDLSPAAGGVAIRHTITAGWPGPGRILDPLLRLWFSARFRRDMDSHVHAEFRRLAALLAGGRLSA